MTTKHRHHARLPADRAARARWLALLLDEVRNSDRPLHPAVQDLADFIETDPRAWLLFQQMFEQVPPTDTRDPAGEPQVRDWRTFMRLLDAVIRRAPAFNKTGIVGAPLNALLDRAMATPAGYAAFLMPEVNARLKTVLDEWGRFLRSPDSRHTLTDDPRTGWFGADATKAMPRFAETFACDPSAPHHGFASRDDFFTRRFRPGLRAVADPDDPKALANACESAPFALETGVKRRDRFWIKEQPYSLAHMLADDALTDRFVGGAVYQAYLSATAYHRWHSPTAGRIVKAYTVPGTYYSETLADAQDPEGPHLSQGYITALAARAVVFLEADDPALGLLAMLFVGMGEVSSCEIAAWPGQRVEKGQEIGMFHYGGSTWCLLAGPDTRLAFDLHGQKPGPESEPIPVNARLARAEA